MLKVLQTLYKLEKAKADKAALAHARTTAVVNQIQNKDKALRVEETTGLEVPIALLDPQIRTRWLYENHKAQANMQQQLKEAETERQKTGKVLRKAIAKSTALKEIIETKEHEAKLEAERRAHAKMMEGYQ